MEWRRVLRLIIRKYQRWQYHRTPRPAFVPTVTPIERTWSATDERLERDLYLANPRAVWLRPDRNEHKIPCWQIEGFWEAPLQIDMRPPKRPLLQYGDIIRVDDISQWASYQNAAQQAQGQYMNGLAAYQRLGMMQNQLSQMELRDRQSMNQINSLANSIGKLLG